MSRQPNKTVHVFDYLTYEGFTPQQIKNFVSAKKKRKQKVPKRKTVKA